MVAAGLPAGALAPLAAGVAAGVFTAGCGGVFAVGCGGALAAAAGREGGLPRRGGRGLRRLRGDLARIAGRAVEAADVVPPAATAAAGRASFAGDVSAAVNLASGKAAPAVSLAMAPGASPRCGTSSAETGSCDRVRGAAAFRCTRWRSASRVATFSATFTPRQHIAARRGLHHSR
ncbi:hypothetical protein SCE1572_18150 [Sorangium cellulosum So0157-2]|uniref:Uncharacterized protein n=1 Tax=Sorangium cellulosum So0157-2 TaxID=1254432 RepID=S4Y007_SORCE|nr:hypothetical protein SCE1572_18150 [Sorangium cellulosum So0157-2]